MEKLLEHRPWRTYLICIALNFLNAQATHSAKGTVQEIHIDSKFECNASHRLNLKASSEIQCVQRCAKNEKCELLNYNYQWKEKGIEENCEIYMLSRYDSSCKTAPNATGWKAAIYNVSLIINNVKKLRLEMHRMPQGDHLYSSNSSK